jgi:hypothetical protein
MYLIDAGFNPELPTWPFRSTCRKRGPFPTLSSPEICSHSRTAVTGQAFGFELEEISTSLPFPSESISEVGTVMVSPSLRQEMFSRRVPANSERRNAPFNPSRKITLFRAKAAELDD